MKKIISTVLVLALTGLTALWASGTGEQVPASRNFVPAQVRGGNNASPLAPLAPAPSLADDQARFDSYVKSVQWLLSNKDNVVILDARSKAEYEKGHIPGAVQAHWTDWSNVAVPQGQVGWSVLFSQDDLATKLAAVGIDGTKPVVIYNDPMVGWGEEGRQLWSLRVFGLTNTYILNGGLGEWVKNGGAVVTTPTVIPAVSKPRAQANLALTVTTDYLAANLGKVKILDVREPEEYNGEKVYGERQKGRIPGAQHVWFKDFYNPNGTLQTPAQLRARFQSLGYNLNDTIVAYCTGGIRSGFSTIALQIAGYKDSRNYDASFSEWTGTNQVVEK